MNRVLFSQILKRFNDTWRLLHDWGRIIRSPYFIDIMRLLHLIVMGKISSELIDDNYLRVEYERRYGGKLPSEAINLAKRERFIERKRGTYDITLGGRLFLFVVSDALVEIENFHRTPPTAREVNHILRLLAMLRVYEKEGFITENIGLLTTALASIRTTARIVPGQEEKDLYDKLVQEYEFIKNLASQVSQDDDFSKALTTLANLIDTEITFIREHIDEIKRLRRRSQILLYISLSDLGKIQETFLKRADEFFKFNLIPVSKMIMPAGYLRKYSASKMRQVNLSEERVAVKQSSEKTTLPSAEELFHIIWNAFMETGFLPDMSSDIWWLEKLPVFRKYYYEYKERIGYKKALRARKVMALSMFLSFALADKNISSAVKEKGEEYFKEAYRQVLS